MLHAMTTGPLLSLCTVREVCIVRVRQLNATVLKHGMPRTKQGSTKKARHSANAFCFSSRPPSCNVYHDDAHRAAEFQSLQSRLPEAPLFTPTHPELSLKTALSMGRCVLSRWPPAVVTGGSVHARQCAHVFWRCPVTSCSGSFATGRQAV